MNNLLIPLKNHRPELSLIHSQVLQNIAKHIKDSYTNFFARHKVGLRAGLPRFKKYGRYKSVTYPQSGFKVEGKNLLLSKIGSINIKLHRPLKGKLKTLTIKKMPTGKWFICFSCEIKEQSREKPFKDVGLDVGLNNFAVLSDGKIINNPGIIGIVREGLLVFKDDYPGQRREAVTGKKSVSRLLGCMRRFRTVEQISCIRPQGK